MYTTSTPMSVLVPSKHEKFDNGTFNGSFTHPSSVNWVDKRVGTKVEEFANKIRKHEDASSDFESDTYTSNVFPGSITMDYIINGIPNRPFRETFTGVLNPVSVVTHLIGYTDEEKARAVSKLVDRLRDSKTVFNSVPFLGELRETMKLIANPLAAFRTGLTKHFNLLKLNREKAKKVNWKYRARVYQDMVTGSYLEWVFGAMPLYSDITGMLEVLKKYSERSHPASRQTVRTSYSSSDASINTNSNYVDAFSEWYLLYKSISLLRETDVKVQYTVGIDITQELNKSALDRLLDLSGFRLDEFAVGVYNAMPWTWLIDYLTTMGDFLSASTLDSGNIRWINETITQRTFVQQFTAPPSFSQQSALLSAANRSLQALSGDFGYSNMVRTTVVRKKLTTFPKVPLMVYHPGIPSIKRFLNVSAVALQLRDHSEMKWLSKRGP